MRRVAGQVKSIDTAMPDDFAQNGDHVEEGTQRPHTQELLRHGRHHAIRQIVPARPCTRIKRQIDSEILGNEAGGPVKGQEG
jgi:hypothetical protein